MWYQVYFKKFKEAINDLHGFPTASNLSSHYKAKQGEERFTKKNLLWGTCISLHLFTPLKSEPAHKERCYYQTPNSTHLVGNEETNIKAGSIYQEETIKDLRRSKTSSFCCSQDRLQLDHCWEDSDAALLEYTEHADLLPFHQQQLKAHTAKKSL